MYVYVIGPDGGPYKIGFTNNLRKRLDAIQNASPVLLKVRHHVAAPDQMAARRLEARAHSHLSALRIRGEWFACDLPQAVEALSFAVEATQKVPDLVLDHDSREASCFASWMEHEGFSLRGASEALGCSLNAAQAWKKRRPPRYILMACYGISMKLPSLDKLLERDGPWRTSMAGRRQLSLI